jgi:hypothetical protein
VTFLILLFGIMLPVVCEAITQIIGFSELFKPIRDFAKKRKILFFDSLLSCKYCLSVWIAMGVTASVWIALLPCTLTGLLFMGIVVIWVHRVSNIVHLVYDILYQYKMWRWTYSLDVNGGKE